MSETTSGREESARCDQRVVKRYSNRKLYDTRDSRYVTLLEIAEMIRAGEDVQIVDNATKDDKTDITLALIISEQLRIRPSAVPVSTLRLLIRGAGAESNEGPPDAAEGNMTNRTSEAPLTLEQWEQAVDARIQVALAEESTLHQLREQVRALSERLESLERALAAASPTRQE